MSGPAHVLAIDTSHIERGIQAAIRDASSAIASSLMGNISSNVFRAVYEIQAGIWVEHLRTTLSDEQFIAVAGPLIDVMSKAQWHMHMPRMSADVHRQADGTMAISVGYNLTDLRVWVTGLGLNCGPATFGSQEVRATCAVNVPSPLVTVNQPNVNVFEQPRVVATKQTFERDAEGELSVAISRPIYSDQEVAP